MALIRLYTDDSYNETKTFKIVTAIWGAPKYCEEFEKDIANYLMKENFQKTFKGVHSRNITKAKWNSSIGKAARAFLKLLKSYILNDKLNAQQFIIGKGKIDKNITYLKNIFDE